MIFTDDTDRDEIAVENDPVCPLSRALFHNKLNRYYSNTHLALAQLLYPSCEF